MSTRTVDTGQAVAETRSLQAFEGFLQKAGKLIGVALLDVVRFALPISALVGAAEQNQSAEEAAFLASVQLIGGAVIAIEQKWSADGSTTGAQKLADVLLLVEQPVIALFAAAGLTVDSAYVVSLVNGIVAMLNAQPADVLVPLEQKAA